MRIRLILNLQNHNILKENYGLRELNTLLHAHNTVKTLTKQQKKGLFSKIENEFTQLLRSKIQN